MLHGVFGDPSIGFSSSSDKSVTMERPFKALFVSTNDCIESRYPKRKRERVTYSEIEDDELLLEGQEEEDYEPKKKVCHIHS